MLLFLEHLLNGLTLGAFYALVTLGLALIFGVVRMVNFAHGDFFMLGGYLLFVMQTMRWLPLPYPLMVLLAILMMAAYGILFERIVARPIIDKPWSVHMVATLASSIVVSSVVLLIFTTDPKQTPTVYSTSFLDFHGIRLSVQRLIVIVVVILVYLLLQWFLHRTKTGKALRAVSQNRAMCMVVGIDIRRMSTVTFAISAALAGLAGVLLAPLFSVNPSMGMLVMLKALAAVIMGGMGQLTGGFVSAFILGLLESLFAGYVPGGFAYRDVVSFAAMMFVLIVRPRGLFGRKVGL